MPKDPTYIKEIIDSNPIWKLAFFISELTNDNAPIGWSSAIPLAGQLLRKYEMKERDA